MEKDSTLALLDTLVTRNANDSLSKKWYRKPKRSTRNINYSSEHPKHMLVNVATNLKKNRAIRPSSEEHKQEAVRRVRDILIQNLYPTSLENRIIHYMAVADSSMLASVNLAQNHPYFCLPFVTGLSQTKY